MKKIIKNLIIISSVFFLLGCSENNLETNIETEKETVETTEAIDNLPEVLFKENSNDSILTKHLSYQIFFFEFDENNNNTIYFEGYADRQGNKAYRAKSDTFNSEYRLENLPYMVSVKDNLYTLVEGNNTSPLKGSNLYNEAQKEGKDVIKTILGRDSLYIDDLDKLGLHYDDVSYNDDYTIKHVTISTDTYRKYDYSVIYDINVLTAVNTVLDEHGNTVYFDLNEIERANVYENMKKDINSIMINREHIENGVKKTYFLYKDVDDYMVVKELLDDFYYVRLDDVWYKYIDKDHISKAKLDKKAYSSSPIVLATGRKSAFDPRLTVLTSYEEDGKGIIIQDGEDIRRESVIDLDTKQIIEISENNDKYTIEVDVNEPEALINTMYYVDSLEE